MINLIMNKVVVVEYNLKGAFINCLIVLKIMIVLKAKL